MYISKLHDFLAAWNIYNGQMLAPCELKGWKVVLFILFFKLCFPYDSSIGLKKGLFIL